MGCWSSGSGGLFRFRDLPCTWMIPYSYAGTGVNSKQTHLPCLVLLSPVEASQVLVPAIRMILKTVLLLLESTCILLIQTLSVLFHRRVISGKGEANPKRVVASSKSMTSYAVACFEDLHVPDWLHCGLLCDRHR